MSHHHLDRRSLLKAGTTAAIGSLLAGAGRGLGAQEQAAVNGNQVKSVPPLAARVGMRLATCALGPAGAPGLVVVLDDGTLVDVKAEAARQKTRLDFEPGSVLELVKSGNAGLEQVRAIAAKAASRKSGLLPVRRRASCRRSRGRTATSIASAGTTSTTSRRARTRAPTSTRTSCRSTPSSSPRPRTR